MPILLDQKLPEFIKPVGRKTEIGIIDLDFTKHQTAMRYLKLSSICDGIKAEIDHAFKEFYVEAWDISHHILYGFDCYTPDKFFAGHNWAVLLGRQIAIVYGRLVYQISKSEDKIMIPEKRRPPHQNDNSFQGAFGFILGDAIQNAVRHGHHYDSSKKVTITTYLGENGIAWSVAQESGFDIRKSMETAKNKQENNTGGKGFAFFQHVTNPERPIDVIPRISIGFNNEGTEFMMRCEFTNNAYKPL